MALMVLEGNHSWIALSLTKSTYIAPLPTITLRYSTSLAKKVLYSSLYQLIKTQ